MFLQLTILKDDVKIFTANGVIAMKKKKILILSLITFFIVAVIIVFFLMLQAALDYKIMSHEAKVMAYVKEEQQIYSDAIFEDVEVIRPWYSLDPNKWIYRVTLKDGEVLVYKRPNGTFIQIN
mgnify:CR=1 FL=1